MDVLHVHAKSKSLCEEGKAIRTRKKYFKSAPKNSQIIILKTRQVRKGACRVYREFNYYLYSYTYMQHLGGLAGGPAEYILLPVIIIVLHSKVETPYSVDNFQHVFIYTFVAQKQRHMIKI